MAVIPYSRATTPLQLRPLNIIRDLPAVANLVENCFSSTLDDDGRRYLQQMRHAGQDNAFLRWASQVVETASMPLSGFVWEDNGEIIGNASVIPYRHDHQRFYLIANVAVHPNQRRRGIGRALTIACMDLAQRKQAKEIWLQVRDDNPGAIALYETLGFRERARRTSWRLSLERVTSPVQPSVPITRRRKSDWLQQEKFLQRIYPDQLSWYQPMPWHSFRPGLMYTLERFFLADETSHWVIRSDNNLTAALTWTPSTSSSPDRLWAAVPPDGSEESLLALLLRARKDLATLQSRLLLDFPAGEYNSAIQQAGFNLHRTLVWMQLDETYLPEKRI